MQFNIEYECLVEAGVGAYCSSSVHQLGIIDTRLKGQYINRIEHEKACVCIGSDPTSRANSATSIHHNCMRNSGITLTKKTHRWSISAVSVVLLFWVM